PPTSTANPMMTPIHDVLSTFIPHFIYLCYLFSIKVELMIYIRRYSAKQLRFRAHRMWVMQPARQDVAVPSASGLPPNPPRPLRSLRCIGRVAKPQERQ